jgi:hypothetical protein
MNSSHVPSSVDGYPHDVAQIGQCGAVEVADSVRPEELAHCHQQRGTGAGQNVGSFSRGVAGVQRHHGGTGIVGGQAGNTQCQVFGDQIATRSPVARRG